MNIEVRQEEPVGPVRDAQPPIAAQARVQWTLGTDWTLIPHVWVMAWTEDQILVFWRNPGMVNPMTVWLRKDQVRPL